MSTGRPIPPRLTQVGFNELGNAPQPTYSPPPAPPQGRSADETRRRYNYALLSPLRASQAAHPDGHGATAATRTRTARSLPAPKPLERPEDQADPFAATLGSSPKHALPDEEYYNKRMRELAKAAQKKRNNTEDDVKDDTQAGKDADHDPDIFDFELDSPAEQDATNTADASSPNKKTQPSIIGEREDNAQRSPRQRSTPNSPRTR